MRGAYWAWLDIPAAEGVQLQLGSSGGVACAWAQLTSKASLCGGGCTWLYVAVRGCTWLCECVRARARVRTGKGLRGRNRAS